MESRVRKKNIDLLKGISIIFVVLYHMGLLESGYLGVDIFFVIAGFLTINSVKTKIEDNSFSFWQYIKGKIIRFLPLILVSSILCLIIGFVFWLPDDYENLSESIIASTFFSNNILSAITTVNYWDTVNDFKPLMHMWYLGILMEFYVIIPFLLKGLIYVSRKIRKDSKKVIGGGICLLCIISLILFLLPQFSTEEKFYHLSFRFFEIGTGCIVGLFYKEIKKKWLHKRFFTWAPFVLLLLTLCIGLVTFDINKIGVETVIIGGSITESVLPFPNSVLVPLTVFLTSILLISSDNIALKESNVLCCIGKRSYSIFVWHQVILALYRYSISPKVTITFVICYLIALALISEFSYGKIEQKIKTSSKSLAIMLIFAFVICCVSGVIYLNDGVVRDVPELQITKGDSRIDGQAEYADWVYRYDVDFEQNGKLNVLVIGNSFARDFANVILESDYDVNLSYIYTPDEKYLERIKHADRVFIFSDKEKVPDYIWNNNDHVYGIGTKNFGSKNGNIYSHRFFSDYYSQCVDLDVGYRELNDAWKRSWGEDCYVDMIAPVTMHDGKIRVFTDENMFISGDCRHLTQAGARYYSKIISLDKYLN